MNQYIMNLLNFTNSNTDIQGVSNPYAACTYNVSYILKTDEGLNKLSLKAPKENDGGDTNTAQQLSKIENIFVNASTIPAQETSD